MPRPWSVPMTRATSVNEAVGATWRRGSLDGVDDVRAYWFRAVSNTANRWHRSRTRRTAREQRWSAPAGRRPRSGGRRCPPHARLPVVAAARRRLSHVLARLGPCPHRRVDGCVGGDRPQATRQSSRPSEGGTRPWLTTSDDRIRSLVHDAVRDAPHDHRRPDGRARGRHRFSPTPLGARCWLGGRRGARRGRRGCADPRRRPTLHQAGRHLCVAGDDVA